MRLSILAYYTLLVILFIQSVTLAADSDHKFYLQSSGSAEILTARDMRFSAGTQFGGILEQGFLYSHSSGISAGILAGAGTFAQGITKEYVVYRGFDYYRLGLSAGYMKEFNRYIWLSLLQVNGVIARYEASVQEFFYPEIQWVNGIGLGSTHKAFLSLPVTVQFRSDLDAAVSVGIGFKLLLDVSPSYFIRGRS